jgi:uncharacterized protein DUF6378
MICPKCGEDHDLSPGKIFYCKNKGDCLITKQATNPRDPLLQDREKTHGSFHRNATTWEKLCTTGNFNKLMIEQKLALSQIYLKLARIEQNPLVKDHWDDIAGYAKLGSEACD